VREERGRRSDERLSRGLDRARVGATLTTAVGRLRKHDGSQDCGRRLQGTPIVPTCFARAAFERRAIHPGDSRRSTAMRKFVCMKRQKTTANIASRGKAAGISCGRVLSRSRNTYTFQQSKVPPWLHVGHENSGPSRSPPVVMMKAAEYRECEDIALAGRLAGTGVHWRIPLCGRASLGDLPRKHASTRPPMTTRAASMRRCDRASCGRNGHRREESR
jgi:hypothetical protein